MKYSNECRRLSQLILTYRDSISLLDSSSIDPLKPYKDLVVDLSIQDPTAKEKLVELLKYQHYLPEAEQLSEWVMPRFPVSGATLSSKGIQPGPNFKKILDQLREAWKKSHFNATEDQLIDQDLPHILEDLNTTASNPKKSKKN